MIVKREIYQYTCCLEKHGLPYVKVKVLPSKEMVLGILLHTPRNILEKEYSILKRVKKNSSFEDVVKEYKEYRYPQKEHQKKCLSCEYKGACWNDSDN